MEKQKVYVVMSHFWRDGLGEGDDEYIDLDSIWSRKEDAKRRVDDLANEWVRQEWYVYSEMDIDEFYYKDIWDDDKASVKLSRDTWEEQTYYIDEFIVDPVIKDFTGP